MEASTPIFTVHDAYFEQTREQKMQALANLMRWASEELNVVLNPPQPEPVKSPMRGDDVL